MRPTAIDTDPPYTYAVNTDEEYLTDGVLWLLATFAGVIVVGTIMMAANLLNLA